MINQLTNWFFKKTFSKNFTKSINKYLIINGQDGYINFKIDIFTVNINVLMIDGFISSENGYINVKI